MKNCSLCLSAIPEDALNDESGEEEDKENPDERISSQCLLCVHFVMKYKELISNFLLKSILHVTAKIMKRRDKIDIMNID